MNTKPVPAIISLTAGLVTCIINLVKHTDFQPFALSVLIVLVAFYIFGVIVKIVLDKVYQALSNPLGDMDEDVDMDADLIDDTFYDEDIVDFDRDMDMFDGPDGE